MSKISEIIKAHESGNNLHFIKKSDLELKKTYPIIGAMRRMGTFGDEIRITLAETDADGKHYCVTNGAKRPDGRDTAVAMMYEEFLTAGVLWSDLGVFVTEEELFNKPCCQLHFCELV